MKKLVIIFVVTFFSTIGLLVAGPVFNCNKCSGTGRITVSRQIRCTTCNGQKLICRYCNGRGYYVLSGGTGPYRMADIRKDCIPCLRTGTVSCSTCYGSHVETLTGTDTCPQCNGKGTFTL